MKTRLAVLLAIVVLASCSAPKYSYNFDHYNYHAGKKQSIPVREVAPLAVSPQELVASAAAGTTTTPSPEAVTTQNTGKTYLQMNKAERKALRHQIKKDIKHYVASKKKTDHVQATQAGMDHDLKLAVIFGAVGIVGLIIGGDVFTIIGGIALLIGVVFFVKWIIRQ